MAKAPRSAVQPAPVKSQIIDGTGAFPSPSLSGAMTFKEIGSSGLRQFGGWVREEFLPALQGRQGARVYREMLDNSASIGAVMFAIIGVMRKVEWRTEPADESPEAAEKAEFADSLRGDMSDTWEDFIAEALSMLAYGYSAHEIVYKRRNGPLPNSPDTPPSRYNDNLIGIHKLPIRGQDTIFKWFFGVNGEIEGLTQQPWIGPLIDIPIEKMVIFRPSTHKNNPEGRSILRNSYRSYFFIKRLEEMESVALERFSGLPVMTVPSQLLEQAAAGNANASAALAAYKKLVTNVRIDEQMGILIPSDTFMGPNGPSSVPMYSFKLETPQGSKSSLDFNTPITRHKNDIFTSLLADFLEMGHSSRGAQNLAETKVDLFMQAVEGWLNAIAAVMNRHLLPKVWKLNGFDPALMPAYVPDMAQRIDLDAISNYILRLSQAGMPLFPDPDLEGYIRDAAGLPEASDEFEEAMRENAGAIAEDSVIPGEGGEQANTKPAPVPLQKRSLPTPAEVRKMVEAAVARRKGKR